MEGYFSPPCWPAVLTRFLPRVILIAMKPNHACKCTPIGSVFPSIVAQWTQVMCNWSSVEIFNASRLWVQVSALRVSRLLKVQEVQCLQTSRTGISRKLCHIGGFLVRPASAWNCVGQTIGHPNGAAPRLTNKTQGSKRRRLVIIAPLGSNGLSRLVVLAFTRSLLSQRTTLGSQLEQHKTVFMQHHGTQYALPVVVSVESVLRYLLLPLPHTWLAALETVLDKNATA